MHQETLYDLGHFLPFGYAFDSGCGMRRVTYRAHSSGKHSSGNRHPFDHLESTGNDPVRRATERC